MAGERDIDLKSAVHRQRHLAEAKCTEEACLRRGHSPKVNPKGAQACARRGVFLDFLDEIEIYSAPSGVGKENLEYTELDEA